MLQSDQTQVNYGPRTWWKYDMRGAGPVQGPVPSGPVGGDYPGPAQVKQWLDKGVGKIVGHPYVDGHQTVELSIYAGSVKMHAIFADVHTYQVVRSIDYFKQGHGPAHHGQLQWVPRTPAMVKLVNNPRHPGRLHPGPGRRLAAGTARCARAPAEVRARVGEWRLRRDSSRRA